MRKGHAGSLGGMPRDLDAPTVMIVHGAWVDATDWREVIALLQVKGSSVVAVQNPLSSLRDDVDTVTRAINHQSNLIVLVGQGYGGTVITQAGNHPRVAALVYVAAFAPDAGESTADAQKDYPPPPCVARLEVDAGGFLYLAAIVLTTKRTGADDLAITSPALASEPQEQRKSCLRDGSHCGRRCHALP